MKYQTIDEILGSILLEDKRYTADAYLFVQEGLEYTVNKLKRPRHVSGQELLDGIRKFALNQYGPVTKRVLTEWGINECLDIGNIVFNLVHHGLLGKTEKDSIEDFMEGYDFNEAFIQPFRSATPPRAIITRHPSTRSV
ncbi:MAG: hypothetical protein JXR23_02800 [Pontiellaceae bacterium]|nr:hypothetical protein [Pontiellaceae bacterium]